MTTAEGNVIIAKFSTDGKTVRTAGGARAYLVNGVPVKPANLQYHSSWDCLMDVVEKIEAIHHIFEGDYINVRISQGYVEIEGTRARMGEGKIFRNTSIPS